MSTINMLPTDDDMEFINTVAIASIPGLQNEYNLDHFDNEHEYYKFISHTSYNLGKAMLEESKKVRTELMGVNHGN